MSCTAPELYYKRDPAKFDGKGGLTKDPRMGLGLPPITVKCSKCINCRLAHAQEWSLRCMHEASMWPHNIFVTFTYDDDNLPPGWDLDYRDFQLFMHKLRKSAPGRGRFFMCGEYGEINSRPHYHAILFNCAFSDQKFHKRIDGIDYYTSERLSSLWGKGFVLFGAVTLASAGYVARYNLKKITGDDAGSYYQFVDPRTGEVFIRKTPFCESSNRPGIGHDWFQEFWPDCFPCDFLVHGGKKFPVPRYYTKLYERMSVEDAEDIKRKRRLSMIDRKHHPDFTHRRLRAKDELSRIVSQQKRDMK